MLEVLKFIMSDFWIFIGTCILITCLANGLATIIKSFMNRKIG